MRWRWRHVLLAPGIALMAAPALAAFPEQWTGPGWYVVGVSDASGAKGIIYGPIRSGPRCINAMNDMFRQGTHGYHDTDCQVLKICPAYGKCGAPPAPGAALPGTTPPGAGRGAAAPPAKPAETRSLCERLPGLWEWSLSSDVVIRADGTAAQTGGFQFGGKWTCSGNKVTIQWAPLGFTDSLTISPDGNSLNGTNGILPITARRKG